MRALVTGGAGFIGSNLVGRLTREGWEVVVLDDLSSGYRANLRPFPDVDLVVGDIRNERSVDTAAEGCDVIFHLAGSVGNKRAIDHPVTDAEINVIGTIRILEVARRRGIRKVVLASSAGIFGEAVTIPVRENHPVEPDSPYGATKLAAEKLGLAYARLFDMEVVALRYFNVYGINQRYDQYGNVIPIFAHQILRGLPVTIFGDGHQTRDFVHVSDVVEANYLAAATSNVWGAFNIGSGIPTSINRLVALMEEVYGQPVTRHYGPERPGDVRSSVADISKASEIFLYSPKMSLDSGLDEYMQWVKGELREPCGF